MSPCASVEISGQISESAIRAAFLHFLNFLLRLFVFCLSASISFGLSDEASSPMSNKLLSSSSSSSMPSRNARVCGSCKNTTKSRSNALDVSNSSRICPVVYTPHLLTIHSATRILTLLALCRKLDKLLRTDSTVLPSSNCQTHNSISSIPFGQYLSLRHFVGRLSSQLMLSPLDLGPSQVAQLPKSILAPGCPRQQRTGIAQ